MPTNAVPTFYLLGEAHRSAAEGFVHVEAIDDRSRPRNWTIRAHAHAELAQIFLVAAGSGSMLAEDSALPFKAPCLLLVPAGVVHGFRWEAESRGSVVTAAQSFVAELANVDPALSAVFQAPAVLSLEQAAAACAQGVITDLQRELGWSAAGHRAAVSAGLLSLLVLALRSRGAAAPADDIGASRDAKMVARLRERIEQRFRLREPAGAHAAALGVSLTTLRTACARVGAGSPIGMLDQRALLEAKRMLHYTPLSVAEIAYSLGFEDAAYFSRFFARHAGRSPRQYRAERHSRPADAIQCPPRSSSGIASE